MAFAPLALQDYAAELADACGGGEAQAARPMELDNTKHVGSCSIMATPVILGVLAVFWVLRQMLCREKLRQTYSGSEDAPELEEIVATDGGRSRRVESYSSRHGRLVTNAGGSGSGSSKGCAGKTSAPRPKKKKGCADAELEPVLWRRSTS